MKSLGRRTLLGGLAALPAALGMVARPRSARAQDMRRYICVAPDCSPYIYDPADGDPDTGIPPGTPFSDLPDDWYCPDCGGAKVDFIPLG